MKMRLNHINSPLYHPSQFTVVVRAIPWIDQESYSDTLTKFFTDFYASSYLSHQMVYEKSAIQKLMVSINLKVDVRFIFYVDMFMLVLCLE